MSNHANIRLVFQRRLKEVRLQCQLSQKQLGIQAGLGPFVASTRINRYEQGVHEPEWGMVERLAEALNVPPAYLFAQDNQLACVILAFDRLPQSEKDYMQAMLELPSNTQGRSSGQKLTTQDLS